MRLSDGACVREEGVLDNGVLYCVVSRRSSRRCSHSRVTQDKHKRHIGKHVCFMFALQNYKN